MHSRAIEKIAHPFDDLIKYSYSNNKLIHQKLIAELYNYIKIQSVKGFFIMKTRYKLSLLITLFITQLDVVQACQEETISQQIVAEQFTTQEEIDTQLYDLFQRFFDDHDEMPFTQFVKKIIQVLQAQYKLLSGSEQAKCEKMIQNFEKNQDNIAFHIWVPILSDPQLRELMSSQTRAHINSISTTKKISSLMTKLRK